VEREDAGITAKQRQRATSYKPAFRAGVEMSAAMRMIDNDDAIVGAFARRSQHERHFVTRQSEADIVGTRNSIGKRSVNRHANAQRLSKTFLQPR